MTEHKYTIIKNFRYEIKMIGPTTNQHWVSIDNGNILKRMQKHFNLWKQSHGVDHTIKLYDHNTMQDVDIVHGATTYF